MCRFLVFKGTDPILLSHLITKPAHSIINQAYDSRLRLEGPPINADGFGVGWYDPESVGESLELERDTKPCIFKAITPAWSNKNLQQLCSKLKSRLVFAHVRASTSGVLSEENCHPWTYQSLLWMHNGGVSNFPAIKRSLQAKLSDETFSFVNGNTDSEWCFALFLENLKKAAPLDSPTFPHQLLREKMLVTIAQINELCESVPVKNGHREPNLLNFCVTDGESVVVTRYISSKEQDAASLFFSTGTKFEEFQEKEFRMRKDDKRETIVCFRRVLSVHRC
ncbi:N-terminal nucleophile aminohydrolase [Atractiella rhizophila]|nr:N-terminal nucleophile aminohydrolase [Atractiella rhizophila]